MHLAWVHLAELLVCGLRCKLEPEGPGRQCLIRPGSARRDLARMPPICMPPVAPAAAGQLATPSHRFGPCAASLSAIIDSLRACSAVLRLFGARGTPVAAPLPAAWPVCLHRPSTISARARARRSAAQPDARRRRLRAAAAACRPKCRGQEIASLELAALRSMSLPARVFKLYSTQLQRRPWRTQIVTTGALWCAAPGCGCPAAALLLPSLGAFPFQQPALLRSTYDADAASQSVQGSG